MRKVQRVREVRTVRLMRAGSALAMLLVLSACAPGPATVWMPRASTKSRGVVLRVQVREGATTVVREVPLEEYVAATALAEVHPQPGEDALARQVFEMQAVIARTYALSNRGRHAKDGFDLCSTTRCQLYEPARTQTSRWAATAAEAAARTAGEILWFGGAPATVLFHADCGGHTSDAGAVWGGASPVYLAGARDGGPAQTAHTAWTFETTTAALRRALDADARTDVGARLDRIDVAGRDTAGRAELVTLRGTRTFVVRGEVFRDAVTHALGAQSLRSTLFTVTKTRDGYTFSGKGYGHGVGLCQAGAIARLRTGASVNDVLGHYFPGTTLADRIPRS